MKHNWHRISAEKSFANVLQEINLKISNHKGFLVTQRPFCLVEHLKLKYAKWTWSSVLELELGKVKLEF
jgi:hypothetical protein